DIRGNLLATSKTVHVVCADPDFIGTNYLLIARQVAPVLELPFQEVAEKLRPRIRVNDRSEVVDVKYVCLKRKVEDEEWQRVQVAMKQLSFGVDESRLRPTERSAYDRIRTRSLFVQPDEMRFYPNDTLAAHVLGYVGTDDRPPGSSKIVGTVGKEGIELTLNNTL